MTSVFDYISDLIFYLNSSAGILVFMFVYILAIVFLLPASWLSLLSGFLYGPIWGSLIVFFSAFCGASLSFFISQNFFSKKINHLIGRFASLTILEEVLKKGGLKLIILTRLSPIFPFSFLNYFYGLNKIKYKDFLISLFFILPGTYLYCSLGSLANEIREIKTISSDDNIVFTLVSFISTALIFYFVVKYVNDFFKDIDKN